MVDEPTQQQTEPEQVDTPQDKAVSPTKEPKEPKEVHYTQAQYSQMQSTLRSEMQKIKDERQAVALEKELVNADLDAAKAELEVLKSEVDSPYVDDDEKTAAQKLRDGQIGLGKERVKLARERAEFLKDKVKENDAQQATLAQGLAEKFGVDVDALRKYADPLEMLHYLANTEVAPPKKAEQAKDEPLPRPVAPVVGGAAQLPDTAIGKIKAGWGEIHK